MAKRSRERLTKGGARRVLKKDLGPYAVTRNKRLNYKLIRQICTLVATDGLPFDAVCDYLGIEATSFHGWINEGRIYNEALLSGSSASVRKHEVHGDFVLALKKAFAMYRLGLVESFHDSANDRDWMRWLRMLERRDRANYGREGTETSALDDFDPNPVFL